jgi:hypothetical protein
MSVIHFGEAKLLISIGISFCLVSCHQKLGNEAQAASCRVEFCNVQFSSLTFAGLGQTVVKLGVSDRFFRIDGRSREIVSEKLVYIPNDDSDYTAYTGTLDGELLRSPNVKSPMLRILKMTSLRRLHGEEARAVEESFERATDHLGK